jgi:molybdate transport system ATP-binding protein
MSPPATQIEVRLRRPRFTLDFEAAWDERVAVLFGPSGSGKTTLFRAVLGLLPAARARTRLAGVWLEDPARGLRMPTERRGLGWVPQDPTLFPHLSVDQNLRFGAARAGPDAEGALRRAIEVLEIGDLLGRSVEGLSGGERQRVAMARALASGPRALLMDEPLAALDLPLRARVLPYLLRLRDELSIPILYITHDPDEAMLVGEVAVVLDAGRVVAIGSPREVLWSRSVLPLSEALGLENVLDARAVEAGDGGSTVETATGLRLAVPARLERGESVRLGLRAQDLLLSAERPRRISARNVFEGVVMGCEPRDGSAFVRVAPRGAGGTAAPEATLVAKVTAAAVTEVGLRPGATVFVIVKAQALRRLA